ncbi:hypothetical protein AYR46_16525 [Sphingobium yanoikuyae]|uniref:Mov34/MPN/PAD-1 family protein n=1 Tax=Sphingobium yanoikuyae TaxID=13690 RepID=UPI0007A73F88|nr:Mov34/MPN/PAD-1 family protein [Sphingobium yanoikuyae]KZC77764.1 hypothetical protein AYR46_16525 [Sphingobium yanoikuyae]
MTALSCTTDTLVRTIDILRAGGARSEERVVLWLGLVASIREPMPVTEVYEPDQITDIDYFKLPPASLRALMSHLRSARLKILAQVHSHPGKAFHSEADDEWAIIRHVGALSLVLPEFARNITPANFAEKTASYRLSGENEWVRVPTGGPDGCIGVVA